MFLFLFLLQNSNHTIHIRLYISYPYFFFKILFIYLTERDTVRETTQAGGVGEGEAGFPQSGEPDAGLHAGLDPRTLAKRPELKACA